MLVKHFMDVRQAVKTLAIDLGVGNDFFLPPYEGSFLGDVHDADELGVVEKNLLGFFLFYLQQFLHAVEPLDDLLHLLFVHGIRSCAFCE